MKEVKRWGVEGSLGHTVIVVDEDDFDAVLKERDALQGYAVHKPNCDTRRNSSWRDCTCGLIAIIGEVDK